MAAIIASLLSIFGPVLADWLKKCLEERLNDAAAGLPPAASFATEGAAVEALFDAAIDNLPRWAFIRRRSLERMKAASVTADGKLRTAPLTAEELREARDIVGAIRPQ